MNEDDRLTTYQQLKKLEIVEQLMNNHSFYLPTSELAKKQKDVLLKLPMDTLYYLRFFPEHIQNLNKEIEDLKSHK